MTCEIPGPIWITGIKAIGCDIVVGRHDEAEMWPNLSGIDRKILVCQRMKESIQWAPADWSVCIVAQHGGSLTFSSIAKPLPNHSLEVIGLRDNEPVRYIGNLNDGMREVEPNLIQFVYHIPTKELK